MSALLHYGFIHRAFAAGAFIAVSCAVLGVFLLLRKDAMIGHGLSHLTFAGVALGFVLKTAPLPVALVVAVLAALGVSKLKESAGLHGDTAIAIVSSVGLAAGLILATVARDFNVALLSYLFGEILAIEPLEVGLSILLAAAVLAVILGNYRTFLYMTFDRESARVSGVPVRRLDSWITVLAAITIVLGMKVVGILLVSALLVLPAAAGLQAASSFRGAVWLSGAAALISVLVGLGAAIVLDLPAAGTIILTAFVLFGASFAAKKLRS